MIIFQAWAVSRDRVGDVYSSKSTILSGEYVELSGCTAFTRAGVAYSQMQIRTWSDCFNGKFVCGM